MKYRKDIDGLRAIAVISVILFHAGVTSFSGGFVGVDIFFVISGFLITSIITSQLDEGSFSLINFYERRARRILPALFFVMLCTLPFAWFWMLPSNLKEYSQSLVAVPLFTSNILFSITNGYFNMVSELKPLIHTWSLAIEEQYYIVFPLLLLLSWKLRRNWIFFGLLTMAIIGLVAAQWGSSDYPDQNFYLLPSRGWEILIGSLVSLSSKYKTKTIGAFIASNGQIYSIVGIIMILYAIVMFDKNTPSPSIYTLIPTIGTALILIFSNNMNAVGKILGHKILFSIGLISYSAYLWHQPIISFFKFRSFYGYSDIYPILVLPLSLILSYFSWKYIEIPFRNKKFIGSKGILYFSCIGTVFFITVGSFLYFENGLRHVSNRFPKNLVWLSMAEKIDTNGQACVLSPLAGTSFHACNFGDLNASKNIFLYGDSHATAISDELSKALVELKMKGTRIAIPGCNIFPEMTMWPITNPTHNNCVSKFKGLLSYIRKNNADVVLSIRWSFKMYPIIDEPIVMPFKNSEGGIENDVQYREYVSFINGKASFSKDSKRLAVNNFINGFLGSTDNLYVIYPVPEIGWDIARTNISYYSENRTLLDEISIPYSDFARRNRFINSIFSEYQTNKKFVPIKPEEIFCNTFVENRCAAQYKTIPFYYDDDHLSDAGAKLVMDRLKHRIRTDVLTHR